MTMKMYGFKMTHCGYMRAIVTMKMSGFKMTHCAATVTKRRRARVNLTAVLNNSNLNIYTVQTSVRRDLHARTGTRHTCKLTIFTQKGRVLKEIFSI